MNAPRLVRSGCALLLVAALASACSSGDDASDGASGAGSAGGSAGSGAGGQGGSASAGKGGVSGAGAGGSAQAGSAGQAGSAQAGSAQAGSAQAGQGGAGQAGAASAGAGGQGGEASQSGQGGASAGASGAGAAGEGGAAQAGASGEGGSAGSAGAGQGGSGGAAVDTACSKLWAQVPTLYPQAGALGPCDGEGTGLAASLFNLEGLTIDNNGATMVPCVEARCDAAYVYVATNTLPHYDFVQTTPNALKEAPQVFRVPRSATAIAAGVSADSAASLDGCVDAFNQYVTAPATATNREPSHLCLAAQTDAAYLSDTRPDGSTVTYRKIKCLGSVAFLINGVVVAGPNEAKIPDPYGNPVFYYPDKAGEPYGGSGAAALDLCGGHTADTMHYHGVNEACFERDASGAPAHSYASAASTWDFAEALDGACSKESGVVGWSPDGHPIKGPCVCVERNADGSCASVKRARSAWSYRGLGSWKDSDGAKPAGSAFDKEGAACAKDAECCGGGSTCHLTCSHAIFDDDGAPGGSVEGKRCVLRDYSWCTHRFVDRSKVDTSGAGFVYLDRCNGREDTDGYAYHATASFPFLIGCYRDEPAAMPGGNPMGGGPMGGGGAGGGGPTGGGGGPPSCQPGQTQCCGDGFCGGPETKQNCPADCGGG